MSFKIQMLINTSRYEEAEAMIRQELAGNMEEPELFLMLARVLNEQRKFKAAHEAVGEAIAMEPNDPEAYFMRASICRDQGKLKEGVVAIDQAIRINAEDEYYYALKAGLLLDRSRWKECLEAAELGLAIDADNESCLFYRGMALAKLGREDEAGENSMRLLSLDADDAANHVSRGWVLVESGKGAEAAQHFSEALRIESDREDAKAGLTHAVILTRPLMGRLLKGLLCIDRLSIWVVIIGVIVAMRLQKFLEKSDGLEVYGAILDGLIWGVFFVIMSCQLLFEWTLLSSSHTRHALLERHVRGLKWASSLMILGASGYAWWLWGGVKSSPYVPFMILALAMFWRECFESANSWVRKRMGWIMGVLSLLALGVCYVQYFVVVPEARELIEHLKTIGEGDEESPLLGFTEKLESVLKMRFRMVVLPALAIALIGMYRDNVSEWLETKAPDEGWG